MIIQDRKSSVDELKETTVYLLTGDLETARFFSNLVSACSIIGYRVEDMIKDRISLPIVSQEQIGFKEGIYVLFKPKFNHQVPDFVLVDSDKKTISVFELKVNLKNVDSKKIYGEITKYGILKNFVEEIYKDYSVKLYAVDFFNFKSYDRNAQLYKKGNVIEVMSGQDFCDMISVSHEDIMSEIYKNREENRKFIQSFKDKSFEEMKYFDFNNTKTTLIDFYESI